MAHNLKFNTKTKRHAFASAKEKAWHNLGVVVSKAMTTSEAIVEAGLDYTVEKFPLEANIGGERIIVPGKFATGIKEEKKVFGVVGNYYTIVQNKDAFSFFDSIVEEGEAIFETAGALKDGQRIFISAKLPSYIEVKDDLIEQYLFLTNTHDGTGTIQVAFTPVRIVCNNTLNAALSQMSNRVSIRHTTNAQEKLEQAHKIMGITNTLSREVEALFNSMSKVRIKKDTLVHLIGEVIKAQKSDSKQVESGDESTRFNNLVEEIVDYGTTNETQLLDSTKGTLFGAYNAITGYFQNVRDYKENNEKKFSVIMDSTGTGAKYTQTAFDLCVKMLNN
jgi:phage/plasmid-like protein (TIGR03299 family)